jgi:Tol biopolymer transport system component
VTVDRKGSRASLGRGWDRTTGGLAWRPDGRSLWVTVVDEDQASPHPRLIEVGLDTSRRVVLELPGGVRLHDVSADGRVLVSQPNMRTSLHVGGLPSARDRDLSWFGNSQINDLSQDGSRVLFTDGPSPSVTLYSLFLRPRDGGPAVRLVDGVSRFGAKLSPDGRWVAARRGLEGPLRLDSTGTGAAPELPPSGFRQNFGWAWLPDSNGLVVVGRRDDGTVGLVELALSGAAPRPLAGACPGQHVVISPDGRRVACGNHAFLGTAVFIHARDGSGSRQLTTSAPAGILLRWSADGRSLFSHRQGEVPAAILRTDLATGRVEVARTVLPPDPTGVWAIAPAAVTADGRVWGYSAMSWLGDLYVYSGLR